MSRLLCLIFAATFALAGCNLARGQDMQSNTPAPSGDDVAQLKEENASLKKEVADAARTIAQLQAQLAKVSPAAVPDSTAITNAAPTGPLKALPLDATNATVTAAAPGSPATDAGPSRSYTVVKGDSIWKIAHKMYPGDTKNGVDKITEANKDAIGGKPLKIGQVLIIPQ